MLPGIAPDMQLNNRTAWRINVVSEMLKFNEANPTGWKKINLSTITTNDILNISLLFEGCLPASLPQVPRCVNGKHPTHTIRPK